MVYECDKVIFFCNWFNSCDMLSEVQWEGPACIPPGLSDLSLSPIDSDILLEEEKRLAEIINYCEFEQL